MARVVEAMGLRGQAEHDEDYVLREIHKEGGVLEQT
jgi:hypothetical protein